jgi:hypothetical protein
MKMGFAHSIPDQTSQARGALIPQRRKRTDF